jgi:hypothetical protein
MYPATLSDLPDTWQVFRVTLRGADVDDHAECQVVEVKPEVSLPPDASLPAGQEAGARDDGKHRNHR